VADCIGSGIHSRIKTRFKNSDLTSEQTPEFHPFRCIFTFPSASQTKIVGAGYFKFMFSMPPE
jgi:hypothetical protein